MMKLRRQSISSCCDLKLPLSPDWTCWKQNNGHSRVCDSLKVWHLHSWCLGFRIAARRMAWVLKHLKTASKIDNPTLPSYSGICSLQLKTPEKKCLSFSRIWKLRKNKRGFANIVGAHGAQKLHRCAMMILSSWKSQHKAACQGPFGKHLSHLENS